MAVAITNTLRVKGNLLNKPAAEKAYNDQMVNIKVMKSVIS
ncbi:hypothetical protein RC083_03335 [Pseudoalteromonas haloplanktis]|uniref:BON domain-containing protein n=1 Tax=Pseudoalteromonas haloplanktis TaxID=228 RepID=A0ABU1B8F1_PSEHA|nr:hypothetical protein [Pseudoalteromonas haloplanktis]MDQ9090625.1 hypothetical protein [Pseudoalteromonas haloplanktis]